MKRTAQTPFLYKDLRESRLPVARLVQTYRSFVVLSYILIALGVAFLGMLFAPWQQTSRGVGRLIAYNPLERQQVLGASVKGRVARWHVTEGSFVKKGALIATMSDIDPQALSRIQQQRQAIREQLNVAQKQTKAYANKMRSLTDVRKLHLRANMLKIRMTRQKYSASLQKRNAIAAALRTARLNLRRLAQLKKDDIVSNRTLEVAELKVAKLEMSLNIAKASVLAARSEIIEARAQRLKKGFEDQSKISSAEAETQKALDKAASARNKLAKINLKVARQSSQVIRAPRDAVILRLLVNEGTELLKAGDPIAVIVPKTNVFATELWLNGNDTPLLRVGQHVRLQFEGWPAVQFVGWPSAAVGTFGGRVALVDVTNNKAGKFRVVVVPDTKDAPWPQAPFLRQGMKAKGWVLLGQVSIGYELWRQLNGFPPTIDAPLQKSSHHNTRQKKK